MTASGSALLRVRLQTCCSWVTVNSPSRHACLAPLQAAANAITAALQAGVSAHALHKMIDAAAASLRLTAAATAAARPPSARQALGVVPTAAAVQHRHTPHEHKSQSQQQLHESAERPQQKAAKAGTASTQALHAMPSTSEAAAGPLTQAAAAPVSSSPSPGENVAPYSFRRHRRTDMQNRHSSGTLLDVPKAGPRARLKIKPSAVVAERDEHGQQAQHAKQEGADAQEAQDSARTSIRIRLRR